MKNNITSNSPSIKILVGYHKPAVLIKDEIYTPIHLGRALATQDSKDGEMSKEDFEWLCENMIGDDSGDNISHLNRYFCELTGIYWAWKNYDKLGNPDYIGFTHYRRQFVFDEKYLSSDKTPYYFIYKNIDQNYKKAIALSSPEKIMYKICDSDYVFIKPIDNGYSVIQDFNKTAIDLCLEPTSFNLAFDLIKQKYPNFNFAINDFLNSKKLYHFNMFIMKKEIFFRYCEFLFDIAFDLHKKLINYDLKTISSLRTLGFVAERLTSFFHYLQKRENYKINYFYTTFINDTQTNSFKLLPAFKQNNIPIVFASDNNYLLYFAVVLKSILENSDKNCNYDFVVLHSDFLDRNKIAKINNSLQEYKNYSLRFFNMNELVADIKFYTHGHFTKETYYRFFIPKLFKNYEKLIYMDIDMIVLQDISKLYETDLENYCLGVCNDIVITTFLNQRREPFYSYFKENMKNPYDYFNAGLLLFNIQKCLEMDFEKQCLDKLEEIKKPLTVDQDILNFCFEGKVKFLDLKWNVEWNIPIVFRNYSNFISLDFIKNYKQAYENPSIIHYCDYFKSWNFTHLPKAELWWHYAKQTPFYEEILFKNIQSKKQGAVERIKSYLSYQLGSALIEAKNPFKALLLPLTLPYIFLRYKISKIIFNFLVQSNPSLKPLDLKEYSDYNEALNVKKHLSYRLGNALIKNPLTFAFKIKRIYREWRKQCE